MSAAKDVKGLLEAIDEKSDMMLNAILVNEFDIFEDNLKQRAQLLQELEGARAQLSASEAQALGLSEFFVKLKRMTDKAEAELKRYKSELENEHLDNQAKKNHLMKNQKKTNQYHLRTESTISGNLFDRKK